MPSHPFRGTRRAAALALALAVSLLPAGAARAKTLLTGDRSAQAVHAIDPAQILSAGSAVETNVPAAFDGMDVNAFLGADAYYDAGVTGQNTVATVIDAGHIWGGTGGHETLGHVITYVKGDDAAADTDRHATWVGTILGGRSPTGGFDPVTNGIAYDTDLRSGAVATEWTGLRYARSFNVSVGSIVGTFNGAFGCADVVNVSWGGDDPAGEGPIVVALDGFAALNPGTTFVAAAGNTGPVANSVDWPASGSNSITVGAASDANTYDGVAVFSGRGPQDYADPANGTVADARAAVDVVAPGTSLVSAYYGGETGGNGPSLDGPADGPAGGPTFYSSGLQGTSFATPMVAAGAALVNSAARAEGWGPEARDGRVVKAILLNAADKLPGWNNGQADVNGERITTQSLDWAQGTGRLNFGRAYDQQLAGTTDLPGPGGGTVAATGWDYGVIAEGGAHEFLITDTLTTDLTLAATLCWFRNREVDVAALTATDAGLADLDLEIWDATFTTRLAASESTFNDVEHLFWDIPAEGQYGLRVTYPRQVFGVPRPEVYGLAWMAVPEPATVLFLGLGTAGLWLLRRRRTA
jgi:hypothetical protein